MRQDLPFPSTENPADAGFLIGAIGLFASFGYWQAPPNMPVNTRQKLEQKCGANTYMYVLAMPFY